MTDEQIQAYIDKNNINLGYFNDPTDFINTLRLEKVKNRVSIRASIGRTIAAITLATVLSQGSYLVGLILFGLFDWLLLKAQENY